MNVKGSTRGEPPTYIELHNEIGGLDGLRRSLSNEGISREAGQLIACARREGTRCNYEAAWRKWAVLCGEKEMDPFECSLTYSLDFITYLFNEGKLEYRTIGVYRSAISAYHVPINGIFVGKDPSTNDRNFKHKTTTTKILYNLGCRRYIKSIKNLVTQ